MIGSFDPLHPPPRSPSRPAAGSELLPLGKAIILPFLAGVVHLARKTPWVSRSTYQSCEGAWPQAALGDDQPDFLSRRFAGNGNRPPGSGCLVQTLSAIAESAGHLWRLAEQGAIVQYGLPTGAAPATADGSDCWVHQLLGGAVEAINKIEYIIYIDICKLS